MCDHNTYENKDKKKSLTIITVIITMATTADYVAKTMGTATATATATPNTTNESETTNESRLKPLSKTNKPEKYQQHRL